MNLFDRFVPAARSRATKSPAGRVGAEHGPRAARGAKVTSGAGNNAAAGGGKVAKPAISTPLDFSHFAAASTEAAAAIAENTEHRRRTLADIPAGAMRQAAIRREAVNGPAQVTRPGKIKSAAEIVAACERAGVIR